MTPNEKLQLYELLVDIVEENLLLDMLDEICANNGVRYVDPYTSMSAKFLAVLRATDQEKIELAKKLLKKVEIGNQHD